MAKQKFTIKIPAYITVTGKIIQFFSNRLASKYALYFFLRPMPYSLPEREKGMFDNSKQFLIDVPSIGKKINIYEYGTGEKNVLLVHGWSGRGTQLFSIADFLLSKGYKIISFDAPAHGKSKGEETYMREFVECVLEIGKRYEFDTAIGHSLGGMSLINAVRKGLKINFLIAISSANNVTILLDEFVKKMGLNGYVYNYLYKYFEELFKSFDENMEDYSSSNAVKNLNVPVLVMADKDDVDVLLECCQKIHNNAKNSHMYVTEGLGHRRILADKGVINKIYEFIKG